jgi:hypothetical protein
MPPITSRLVAVIVLVLFSFLATLGNKIMVQQGMLTSFFDDTAINSTATTTTSISLSTSTIGSSITASSFQNSQLSDEPTIIILDSRHFQNHTLYICGYDRGDLANHLFPELKQTQHASLQLNTTISNTSSLLVYGLFGPCPIRRKPKRYDIGLE